VPVVFVVRITVLLRSSGRGGFGRLRAGHESLNRLTPVSWGEVGIALDHREVPPPAEILDREEIHRLHRESRGEGVPEVMEVEIVNLGSAYGREVSIELM
jgi:hypothetical protein